MRPHVPKHAGKDVHYWMLQTRSSALKDNPGLSAIGTNAVPYLAQALRIRKTRFDRHEWLRRPEVHRVLTTFAFGFTWPQSARSVQDEAAFSLLAYGFEARPALSALHDAMIDPALEEQTRQNVVHVLLEIGPLPESLPFLLAAWPLTTNSAFWPTRHDLVLAISRL